MAGMENTQIRSLVLYRVKFLRQNDRLTHAEL
jgi:hypothetical protein